MVKMAPYDRFPCSSTISTLEHWIALRRASVHIQHYFFCSIVAANFHQLLLLTSQYIGLDVNDSVST